MIASVFLVTALCLLKLGATCDSSDMIAKLKEVSSDVDTMITMTSQCSERETWKKINVQPVCFEGKGNKPGIVENVGEDKMIGAVKLVYRSGSIRCSSDEKYTSRWGCYNWPGIERHPLNVIITDKDNHRIFPLDKYLNKGGGQHGLWYYMPDVDVKSSNELVFSNYMDPLYFRKDGRLFIWYGEDLKNWYDYDDFGRVCVDVYMHAIF